jgi:hypothetical protein
MGPYASEIWRERWEASHPPRIVPTVTERVPSALRRVFIRIRLLQLFGSAIAVMLHMGMR